MKKNNIHFYQKGSVEFVEGQGVPEFLYHTHESFLVGVVKNGSAHFVIGNEDFILSKGMSYIVPANIGISITPLTEYSYLTICLKGDLEKQLRPYKIEMHVLPLIGTRIEEICERFKLIGKEDEFMRELIEILNLNFLRNHKNNRSNRNSDIVVEGLGYIKRHVNEKFVLEDLCKSICISKYYFIRKFKREMGITPKQYDQQCKIRHVKQSILTKKPMIDIATEMNFSAQSHLCNMFKRYMGISMKDYKNNSNLI